MKWEKDKRVNANESIKDSILIFLALVVVNGNHMMIFQTIEQEGRSVMFQINALIGWLIFSTIVLTALYSLIRHFYVSRPMRHLSAAAKKVAAGDFSVRVAPLRKDGKKDYIEVMFEDFNTMAKELESIETMKTDFITNVSHEIKTPLAVIQNYASVLQNDTLDVEDRHEYIKNIINSSQKLSALVSNILKLNKLENQGILPGASSYELGEQLRRCALAFEDLWERKNIRFDADLDEIAVRYDESMLEIVWNNLIANAVKFTAPGGSISLSLKKAAGGLAKVQVRDSGCGMDEETQKRIFDKFYQGDSSHAQEGNGLGLALVKKAIALVGADIRVKSAAGKGTTFTVRLKLCYPPHAHS
ncbi:MAG: HAMP domain-containing histidine kinase [Treponema sp.]|nr:HAMP domain-containing histidine kinase [Treponema sp.]